MQRHTVKITVCMICIFLPLVSAAGKSSADSWPVIQRGDMDLNAVDVRMIQYLLRIKGFTVLADGVFGKQTQTQVERFQRSQQLPCTGRVGEATWRKLLVVVRPGDHGEAVIAVQASLQQYDEKLPIDGYFSKRTAQALRKFEREKHLPLTTIVNEDVWLRLTDGLSD